MILKISHQQKSLSEYLGDFYFVSKITIKSKVKFFLHFVKSKYIDSVHLVYIIAKQFCNCNQYSYPEEDKELKKYVQLSVLAIIFASSVNAEVQFSGFGTVAVGSSNDELFGTNKDGLDFKSHSLFALQATSDLSEGLSATAQIMAKGQTDFNAEFEWAYLSYQATESLRINAGRIRTPFYKYSDFMDVGYAYQWVLPPQSVYSMGFDQIEGLSFNYTKSWDDLTLNSQFIYGNSESDTDFGNEVAPTEIQGAIGGNIDLNYGNWTTRVAYYQGDITMEIASLDPLLAGLKQFGFSQLANNLQVEEDKATFVGAGVFYEGEKVFLNSEWTRAKSGDNFIADLTSYYVSPGYNVTEKLSLYYLYEKDSDSPKVELYNGLPAQLPFTPVVSAVVESLRQQQTTHSVGLTYDFHSSASFKVQYFSQEDTTRSEKNNGIFLAVDFVF